MINDVTKKYRRRTYSISAENPTGEKGKGGMATEGTGSQPAEDLGPGWKMSPYIFVEPKQVVTIAEKTGSGAIRHIWMTCNIGANRDMILRCYWDGSSQPAVEVPLGDFFAAARSKTEFHQINSLAVCVNSRNGLNCYWEMPYRKSFKITIENLSPDRAMLFYQIDGEEKEVDEDTLYFHAQFRRVNPLPYKEVYTILDNIKGCGQYVGTYMYWGTNNSGWWGEGEIKFYIDGDTEYPTVCGTGTEDYFCGAWSFRSAGDFDHREYLEFSTPYTGFAVDTTDKLHRSQRRYNLYRWHLSDPIYFEEDLRVTIQALGWRSGHRFLPVQDDISSVAYWYSDTLEDVYPKLPDRDYLEII